MLRSRTINERGSGVWIQHQPHQWLMLGYSFLRPTPPSSPRHLNSPQPRSSSPPGAPPLSWGMWAHHRQADGSDCAWERETEGGPMKWDTQVVRHKAVHFWHFSHRWPPHLIPMTRQRANRRNSRRIDETAGESTRQQADQQDGGRFDETTGESTRPQQQANRRDNRRIDDTVGESTRR